MTVSYTYRNIEYLPSIIFGFKIHISATFENYEDVLGIATHYLEQKNIAYKFLSSREDVYKSFSVHEHAGECGKLITIYPSFSALIDTLEDLYQLLQNREGIYILSDRPYKDSSLVFYRFGLFQDEKNSFKDGVPTLTYIDGGEWQDYPKSYFDLPYWIEDIQPPQEEIQESYLGEHYEVTSVLHQSGGGNVYLALDKKFRTPVTLKEVRPHILSFYDVEKKELRDKEYEIATELCDKRVNHLIIPVEKVDEWINSYYIYNHIDGETLTDFCKKYGINSYSRSHKRKNLRLFKSFLGVIKSLVNTIVYLHDNGLVLNDIHPDNFVVDTNDKIHFIDLENSYLYGDKPFVGITSRISLKIWNFLDGKQADFHKLGNVILFLIARLTVSEESQQAPIILDRLLRSYGICSNLSEFVLYLLSEEIKSDKIIAWLNSLYASSIDFQEDIPILIENNKVSFIEKVTELCSSFSRYEEYLQNSKNLSIENEDSILRLMTTEQNLGIEGLSGVISLLHEKGLDDLVSEGLTILLSRLVETAEGIQVPIEGGFFSPYFNNGLSGVIQTLYYIDKHKYRHIILELRKTLYAEFAQYESYDSGALGIADTLLLTASYRKNRILNECIRSLILNSIIYHQQYQLPEDDLLSVLTHYHEVYSV